MVAAVAGVAVSTSAPWRPSDAQAASEAGTAAVGVAAAGFAVEPRTQVGSRASSYLRPGAAPVTVMSAVTRAGESVFRDLPEAYEGVNLSLIHI